MDYKEAFSRNLGLINPQEQETLRESRVAIAGMGGMGGSDLITLVRLGIGSFTIADHDTFSVANTNRQYGAKSSTTGRLKTEVMAEIAKDINPNVDIKILPDKINRQNMHEFLENADLLVDALDTFEVEIRRHLFDLMLSRNKYVVSSGPIGFSAAWLVFGPEGMKFDEYFNINDEMSDDEKFYAFIVGVTPGATHRPYMDLSYVDLERKIGPSSSVGVQLASGAMGAEAVKILLDRGNVRVAPYYNQFDAYRGIFISRKLRGGNKNIMQRLKYRLLKRSIEKKLKEINDNKQS